MKGKQQARIKRRKKENKTRMAGAFDETHPTPWLYLNIHSTLASL